MKLTRADMKPWVIDGVAANGGAATVTQVAKHIWTHHASALQASGDFFYTWQYGMRWASQSLRDDGKLIKDKKARLWRLP